MPSIFSKIVTGDIPSYKIAENDHFYAFLDINPLKKGHTLVIPKIEVDYIFDLDDNILAGLHVFTKKVAIAIKTVIPCQRVGMLVLGMEVPHAHIHLVPLETEKDIIITNPKLQLEPTEMAAIASRIRLAFNL